jgi:hypothetical protein
MDKNHQLILLPQNSLIPKVTTTLSITNKLIFENNRKLVMEIFMKNPELFVNLISRYYPLTENFIEKYEDKWNWDLLSNNKKLHWSLEILWKHQEK